MKLRRFCLLVASLVAMAAPSCSSRIEGTADLEGALVDRIQKALEPGASWVIPVGPMEGANLLRAQRIDLPDGGAVVVLYSYEGRPFDQPLRSGATVFAHVDPTGKVTPIPASPETIGFASVFKVPPAGISCGGDAIVLFCGAADQARTVRVSPSSGTVSVISLNAGALCPSSNGWPKGALGPATGDQFVLAKSDPAKVTLHSCDGTVVGQPSMKETTIQSEVAWAAEIGGGVFAWARAGYDYSLGNMIWTYFQSDRNDVLTTTGTELPLAAAEYTADTRNFGVPLFVREISGALLLAQPSGLRRWHVESDGHVELLATRPPAPYGEWEQFAFGAWLATDMRDSPYAAGRQTPFGSSVLTLQGDGFATQSIRRSPCADQDKCRRLGESFTLAVGGTGPSAAVIQAFWPWELLGTHANAGAVVAVNNGEVEPLPDAGTDSSLDGGEDVVTDASDSSQDVIADASDGAQEDASVECSPACGTLGCDPLGGCNPEVLVSESATAAVGSDLGVFWLAQPGSGGGYARWKRGSDPVDTLGSAEFLWTERSLMGPDSDFAWSSIWGVHYYSAHEPQPATTLVLSPSAHHSARPVGITSTHVVAIAQDQGTPPLDRVHRYAKTSLMTDEVFACAEGVTDAALDPAGRLLMTVQGQLQLFATPQGGIDCTEPTTPVVLADATQLSQASRVVAGSSWDYVAGTGSPECPVYALGSNGQPAPAEIAKASEFTFQGVAFQPLAVHVDSNTVYFVDAKPAEAGPSAKYRIVSIADPAHPVPTTVAIAHGYVSSLEVSAQHVYWTDSRGVLRAPR